ncbi:unnamed protein product [Orchesella dallaii]|uniref:Uncharacterized protein n=1 Tax=Orchesella dallaii TaxID=48710 RepID=A0ABP1QET4_9HEXA
MVIKSAYDASRFVERRKMLYLWLIGSYADQLVSLSLQTDYPLEALQPNHNYYDVIDNNREILVASTSASAYGKLEELKIFHPNPNPQFLLHQEFLLLSKTPVLRRLSLVGSSNRSKLWGYRNLLTNIEKFKNTLEQLYLDVTIKEMTSDDFQPRTEITFPHVKTLAFRFPLESLDEEKMENNFLVMFPALESLQLLCFWGSPFAGIWPIGEEKETGEEDNPALVIEDDEKIAVFSNRVASYNQQMAAWRLEGYSRHELARRQERMEQELGRAKYEDEKYLILHRLLKGGRVWNICKELKSLSISSGWRPSGNVCVRGRPNN